MDITIARPAPRHAKAQNIFEKIGLTNFLPGIITDTAKGSMPITETVPSNNDVGKQCIIYNGTFELVGFYHFLEEQHELIKHHGMQKHVFMAKYQEKYK